MAQIVLIGPIAAGKSSVAGLLAERMGRRQIPLDAVRWYYYFRIGFDFAEQKRREREDGPLARYAYWKPFETYAVEGALADFPDSIIDFGAGHSVQDDEALFARVQAALAPVPHVILLLPSPDLEESLGILSERVPPDGREEVAELNRGFLTSPSNARLATTTIHTGRRSPEEVCEDILTLIG
ncbi:putative Shikimate kinase [Rubellimicrobium mesophilum DSM 19309]|uniref:Putative Shikimate kinase n=1 Tax=Rubellimicrobium mesophilum DSM 19309 TaxID=442562 RepID=A0A017HP26_9RHOB|nr:hypothetical protein [Rubellimicrobium mesophilum]EYD76121.1 putative Shikimate kinase [Rubellimicrobium mesophilum DSM 19309]